MTSALLARVGKALYGPRWQTDIARALGVSDRQVRRWASGDAPVPAHATGELVRLCRVRSVDLAKLAGEIERKT